MISRSLLSSRSSFHFLLGIVTSTLSLAIAAEGATLVDSPALPDAYFGRSVSLSGNMALVGGDGADGTEEGSGAASLFREIDTAIGVVSKDLTLIASDGSFTDRFGLSLSLSGNIALIGASYHDVDSTADVGAVYVYRGLDEGSGTRTEDLRLVASDPAVYDSLGWPVSLSGSNALVGFAGRYTETSAVYLYRNINSGSGQKTEDVKLISSDRVNYDSFGASLDLSENTAIVGASFKDHDVSFAGVAYIFFDLDEAIGTKSEDLKLIASDGASFDQFAKATSVSGNTALVGAPLHNGTGAAYFYRNLTASDTPRLEDLKFVASDATEGASFGWALDVSGNVALVGAHNSTISGQEAAGAVYAFLNIDQGTGTRSEDLKITASDPMEDAGFGNSISIDGDRFVIGAPGMNENRGAAFTGSIASLTTLDRGNASEIISSISFESKGDWIIGDTMDQNSVTLSSGDTANVTATGKKVFIGKTAGADHNTLAIAGKLEASTILIGTEGNEGNSLVVSGTASAGTTHVASRNHITVDGALTTTLTLAEEATIGGNGTLNGDLTLDDGAYFEFTLNNTLTVTGTVILSNDFGVANLLGLDAATANGVYTLIDGTASDFSHIQNWGLENAFALGGGKAAYFRQGSLELVVIPEPSTWILLLGATSLLQFRRKRMARS